MTICPRCKAPHRGPRDLTVLRSEAAHVLVRADAMPMEQAAEYLRTQWLGGALELADVCADCIVTEIAAGSVRVELVARTDEALEAVTGPHVCVVIPMFPKRDLIDVGATFDSTRKP